MCQSTSGAHGESERAGLRSCGQQWAVLCVERRLATTLGHSSALAAGPHLQDWRQGGVVRQHERRFLVCCGRRRDGAADVGPSDAQDVPVVRGCAHGRRNVRACAPTAAVSVPHGQRGRPDVRSK